MPQPPWLGRRKGQPAKITRFRQELAIQLNELLQSRRFKVEEWLDQLAVKSPDKALYFLLKLSMFVDNPKEASRRISDMGLVYRHRAVKPLHDDAADPARDAVLHRIKPAKPMGREAKANRMSPNPDLPKQPSGAVQKSLVDRIREQGGS